jgi:hypothetical protein
VDGADFLAWQRGLGTTAGATRAAGDANMDGDVDADDLAVWQAQFGTATSAAVAAVGVPEPTAFALLAIAAGAVARARRRRR